MISHFFSVRMASALLLGFGVSVSVAQPPQGPPPPGDDRRPGDRRPAMMFDRMDANGDGVIDRTEFLAFRDGIRDRGGRRGPADRGIGAGRNERQGAGGPEGRQGMRSRDRGERGPGPQGAREGFGGPKRDGDRGGAHLERLRGVIEDSVSGVLRDYPPELRRAVTDAVLAGLHQAHEKAIGERGVPRGGAWRRGEPGSRDGRWRDAGTEERDGARVGPDKGADGPPPPPMGGPRRPGWRGRGPDGPPDAKGETPPAPGADQARRGAGMRDDLPREGRPGEAGQRMQFRRIDANGDGFVTADEFPGGPERFKAMDLNNDGKLSKEELRDAMRSFRDGGDRRGRPDSARPGQGRGQRNTRRVVI